MSKTYKGYELYKMIAEGKIKDDCKIKDTKTKYIAIWDGYNFRLEDNNYLRDGYDDIGFAKRDFELIEDEIDIQSIEELKGIVVIKSVDKKVSREENLRRIDKTEVDYFYKINDIVKQQNLILEAVKQLDKNKEDKQNGQK